MALIWLRLAGTPRTNLPSARFVLPDDCVTRAHPRRDGADLIGFVFPRRSEGGEMAGLKMGSLSGVLNLEKSAGMTSRDVVDFVARPLRKVKVGHAGTLDPLASGVLVVCVGA